MAFALFNYLKVSEMKFKIVDNKENKLYILTINNILGVEEWTYLGVTSEHWEDSDRVVFLTDTGAVSIPHNRVFKLEEIKHKTGSDTAREV